MLEYLFLGMLQGIFEWLPVSSEGIVTLVSNLLLIPDPLEFALWLHLGTVLAVLVYFRNEIAALPKNKKLLEFLGIATAVSLPIGFILYIMLKNFSLGSPYWYLITGIGLIATSFFTRKKKSGFKTVNKATALDAAIAGFSQGFAVIPGISRSGITMLALLDSKFSPEEALKLSFLMSVPVVLAANALIVLEGFSFGVGQLLALASAFAFGFASIQVLLKLSKKINVSWFAWWFGVLSLLAYLVA